MIQGHLGVPRWKGWKIDPFLGPDSVFVHSITEARRIGVATSLTAHWPRHRYSFGVVFFGGSPRSLERGKPLYCSESRGVGWLASYSGPQRGSIGLSSRTTNRANLPALVFLTNCIVM